MKKSQHFVAQDGHMKTRNKPLKGLLQLNYLEYTNLTHAVGPLDLPELICQTTVHPDYLALFSQRSLYHHTKRTCVCFFQYDNVFDGQNGLANAIYYKNKKQLEQFKERFKGVKFFISPDYSLLGDVDPIENLYRMKRARLVSIWSTLRMTRR